MINLISILYEATRYKEETGQEFPRWQEQIIKYEEEGGYFIHFSNVPRMNLYLINKYNTPIGFYAYPLDRKKMADFAVNRPYAIILKPKPEAKILNTRTYSESDYEEDVDKLAEMGLENYSLEDINDAASNARRKTPAGKFWNVTRVLSGAGVKTDDDASVTRGGGATGKWTMLLKKLGYDGVYDDCFKIIHPSEPCQAVFFDTTKLDLVKVIDLKDSKIRYKNDLFDTQQRIIKQTENPKVSPKHLATLAKNPDVYIRRGVAANPNTPPEALRELYKDTDNDVRFNVLGNKNTPPDVLEDAATNGGHYEFLQVAENTNTPPEVLRKLSTNKNYQIRKDVAGNESTPTDVLFNLAKNDSELFVRITAISNPKLPVEALESFSKDAEDRVRMAVARSERTPKEVLINLSKDPMKYVSDAAKKTLINLATTITEALIVEKVLRKLLK